MKKLVDINLFGGAFQLYVSPGKYVHWVTLYVKGFGELTMEYSTEKMLTGPEHNALKDVVRDAYDELINDWEEPE